MAITLQTLKHGVANREASATRFSVYYKRGTTPSNNIIRVKNIIHDIHNESVSYSVLVAISVLLLSSTSFQTSAFFLVIPPAVILESAILFL